MLESLISETQAYRLVKNTDNYYYIKPCYKTIQTNEPIINYNSKLNPLNKEDIKKFLISKSLF